MLMVAIKKIYSIRTYPISQHAFVDGRRNYYCCCYYYYYYYYYYYIPATFRPLSFPSFFKWNLLFSSPPLSPFSFFLGTNIINRIKYVNSPCKEVS